MCWWNGLSDHSNDWALTPAFSLPAFPKQPKRSLNGPIDATCGFMVTAELGVVIPFYDEAGCAEHVASSALKTLKESGVEFQLVLVDNGSHDATRRMLSQVAAPDGRAEVVVVGQNRGYGHGVVQGLLRLRARYVGWMDGDGQVGAEAIVALYRKMRSERADFGCGRRILRTDGWKRRFASRAYNALVTLFLGLRFADINAKPKLLAYHLLPSIAPHADDWFLDTEVVFGACKIVDARVRIPVASVHREGGKSKVSGSSVLEFLKNLVIFRWQTLKRKTSLSWSSAGEKELVSANLQK